MLLWSLLGGADVVHGLTAATGAMRSRGWNALLWICALAAAAPILAVRYMPFLDMPEHVAAMATLSRMIFSLEAHEPYVLAVGSTQYLLHHVAGALLTRALGDAILANQILLAAIAIAWPLSFRSLLSALRRDERLALFAPAVFFDRALLFGFLPYIASVPLFFFALAVFVRSRHRPSARSTVAVAVFAMVLFATHLSSYVLFVGIVVTASVFSYLRKRRGLVAHALALAPSAILAFAWWTRGALSSGYERAAHDVGTMSFARTVRALPVWTFDIWPSHADEACAALFWIAFAVVLVVGVRRRAPLPLLPAPRALLRGGRVRHHAVPRARGDAQRTHGAARRPVRRRVAAAEAGACDDRGAPARRALGPRHLGDDVRRGPGPRAPARRGLRRAARAREATRGS